MNKAKDLNIRNGLKARVYIRIIESFESFFHEPAILHRAYLHGHV
jgi:hypothetical protein